MPYTATVTNRGRRSLSALGRWFAPLSVVTIEVDDMVQLRRLQGKRGLRVSEIREGSAPPPAADWGATVKSALAYVGKDPDRAETVLEAEESGKRRQSLMTALETIIAASD